MTISRVILPLCFLLLFLMWLFHWLVPPSPPDPKPSHPALLLCTSSWLGRCSCPLSFPRWLDASWLFSRWLAALSSPCQINSSCWLWTNVFDLSLWLLDLGEKDGSSTVVLALYQLLLLSCFATLLFLVFHPADMDWVCWYLCLETVVYNIISDLLSQSLWCFCRSNHYSLFSGHKCLLFPAFLIILEKNKV